jgi:hypothetical protein
LRARHLPIDPPGNQDPCQDGTCDRPERCLRAVQVFANEQLQSLRIPASTYTASSGFADFSSVLAVRISAGFPQHLRESEGKRHGGSVNRGQLAVGSDRVQRARRSSQHLA